MSDLFRHIRFKDPIVVSEADRKASFERIKERISVGEAVVIPFEPVKRSLSSIFIGAAAAAIAILITVGGFGLYFNQRIDIANNSDQIKEVVLPDGSQLSLGLNSQVSYKRNFNRKRALQLNGQALLNVTHDAAHPFTVTTSLATIRVLGTQFSVRAFDDEAVCSTILLEGSVNVTNETSTVVLKPGNEAIVTSEVDAIKVAAVKDTERALAWKTRILLFEDESVLDILNTIADVYQLKLVIENPNRFDQKYSVKFNHEEDLITKLDVIADVASISYKLNQNELIVGSK